MHVAALVVGLLFCFGAVLDAFQTIILPRRPTGRLRITRLFYLVTWSPWAALARHTSNRKLREQIYSTFGPGSLLLLLVVWATLLVGGFALIFYGLGSPFTDIGGIAGPGGIARFRTDLYVSGTTLFTLGLGDVLPRCSAGACDHRGGVGHRARLCRAGDRLRSGAVRRVFAARGPGGAAGRRAGSPPTSAELLRRHAFAGGQEALVVLLVEWERWSAEILESHVSYPILCYYRSQHDNQSWLSALTAILDSCALLISVVPGAASRQAQLTFAMARHALVDLGHVFHLEEREKEWLARGGVGSSAATDFNLLCGFMTEAGLRLCGDPESPMRLHALRALYEPHAAALADYLGMSLPAWTPEPRAKDQWKTVEAVRSQAAAILKETVISDHADALRLHAEDH